MTLPYPDARNDDILSIVTNPDVPTPKTESELLQDLLAASTHKERYDALVALGLDEQAKVEGDEVVWSFLKGEEV